MGVDLFASLVLLSASFALVPGLMLLITSLGRDAWNGFSQNG